MADISDFFIHIEEVAVTLCNDIFTQTVDSFGEVKEYGKTGVVYAEALVAAFFGSAAGNVTRNEVTECRITAFQVVVAVFLGNIFPCSVPSAVSWHLPASSEPRYDHRYAEIRTSKSA